MQAVKITHGVPSFGNPTNQRDSIGQKHFGFQADITSKGKMTLGTDETNG
ncbi:hypothetical protein GCM10028810_58200 [Spirosoma litoris]